MQLSLFPRRMIQVDQSNLIPGAATHSWIAQAHWLGMMRDDEGTILKACLTVWPITILVVGSWSISPCLSWLRYFPGTWYSWLYVYIYIYIYLYIYICITISTIRESWCTAIYLSVMMCLSINSYIYLCIYLCIYDVFMYLRCKKYPHWSPQGQAPLFFVLEVKIARRLKDVTKDVAYVAHGRATRREQEIELAPWRKHPWNPVESWRPHQCKLCPKTYSSIGGSIVIIDEMNPRNSDCVDMSHMSCFFYCSACPC